MLHKLHPPFTTGSCSPWYPPQCNGVLGSKLADSEKRGAERWRCFQEAPEYQHINKTVSWSLSGISKHSRAAGKKMLPHMWVWGGNTQFTKHWGTEVLFLFFFFLFYFLCVYKQICWFSFRSVFLHQLAIYQMVVVPIPFMLWAIISLSLQLQI